MSTFSIYQWFVLKEKAIYNALNMMKVQRTNYIAFLWAPVEMEESIKQTLEEFSGTEFKMLRRHSHDDHLIDPPTYFKSNAVTKVFQEITNTYGVPKYQEINPSAFAIVTFPF